MRKNRFHVGKNTVRRAAFAMGMLLACTQLGGCQGETLPEKKNAIRIGVSLYRADDTFIGNIRSEMEKRAKAYEQETGIRVTLDIQDAKGNQYTQNKQVERFISLGCDALCVNPVDRTTSSGIIDPAMAADIPVVFFNRQPVEEDLDRWDKLYYVGADAKESAVLEAEIVADQYEKDPVSLDKNGDGVISYVLLEGENNHQDSLIRTEWSVQTLKDRGVPIEKITGGIANWERSQASALMEQWLSAYPDTIELVISNNDDMALGANSFYVDRPGPGQHQGGLCVDSAAHLRRGAGDGAFLPAGQGDAGRARGIGARRGRDGALKSGCFGSSAQPGQMARIGRILTGCGGCTGRGMVVH